MQCTSESQLMEIQLLNQSHSQEVFPSREWERTNIVDMLQSLENFSDGVGGGGAF